MMCIRPKSFFTFLLFLFLSWSAHGNVIGNGLQNFNTIPSGLDFVTIHSSETLKPGIINLGIFANEAVNTLPYFEGGAQGRTNFNDTLLGLDLNMGIGLGPNWDAGISVPFILNQTVNSDQSYHGEFSKSGNTEVRVMTKYRLWGDDSHGVALIGTVNIDRTGNNPYTGVNPGPIYNLEMAWDTTIEKWAVGLNLGYRKTNPGEPVANNPIEPIGNQIIGGAAASYLLASLDTKLIFEVFGSRPAESKSSNPERNASSMELLGGVKHDLTQNLAVHAGGGTELIHGVSSPDWRVYAGLNYAFGPVFHHEDSPVIQPSPQDRYVTRSILFDFDSDKMMGNFQSVLDEIAEGLKGKSYSKLLVVGHTDSIGKDEYNRALSLKRAQAIRKYLIEKKGFSANKLEAIGKGESEPIADNGNFQGRQENRRVEFIFQK